MTAQIINLGDAREKPVDSETALEWAKEADLDCCIILGFTKEDDIYLAASCSDEAEAIWLIERAKAAILSH